MFRGARQEFADLNEPVVMNFRVNAGFIPKEHWTQTAQGGGRILGEVCHFIDLMQFFADSAPVRVSRNTTLKRRYREGVYAECLGAASAAIKNDDNLVVTVRFANGSIGTLTYHANGDKAMPKERLEISAGGRIVVIDDFKSGEVYKDNRVTPLKASGKGHKEEVEAFVQAIKTGAPSPLSFESICLTTVTTFRIRDALATGLPQEISL